MMANYWTRANVAVRRLNGVNQLKSKFFDLTTFVCQLVVQQSQTERAHRMYSLQ